jgi:hypothetical protein
MPHMSMITRIRVVDVRQLWMTVEELFWSIRKAAEIHEVAAIAIAP